MKNYKIKEIDGYYCIYERVWLIFWRWFEDSFPNGKGNYYHSFAKAARRMRELEYLKKHKKC